MQTQMDNTRALPPWRKVDVRMAARAIRSKTIAHTN
jgi:hypothetical protein